MTPHNPLTRHFERKLERLSGFADLVEQTLVTRSTELDARLSTEAENFAEDERHEFFEYHAEDYFNLADALPTILRYSVLMGADTALEVYLNDTCETYAKVNDATLRLDDLKGTGIERARKYLKKVARIPFPDEKPTWTTVLRLHELRNCIVHADGFVQEKQADLVRRSAMIMGLRITASGLISLDRQFAVSAISAYKAFAVEFDRACVDLGLWRSEFPTENA
jgi:hypothetical protein